MNDKNEETLTEEDQKILSQLEVHGLKGHTAIVALKAIKEMKAKTPSLSENDLDEIAGKVSQQIIEKLPDKEKEKEGGVWKERIKKGVKFVAGGLVMKGIWALLTYIYSHGVGFEDTVENEASSERKRELQGIRDTLVSDLPLEDRKDLENSETYLIQGFSYQFEKEWKSEVAQADEIREFLDHLGELNVGYGKEREAKFISELILNSLLERTQERILEKQGRA
jgi:hypothetical protein